MRFFLIAGGFGVCTLGVLCRKTEERVGRGVSNVTEYRLSDSALIGWTKVRTGLGAYSFSGGRLWGTRELTYSFAMTLLCRSIQRTQSRDGRSLSLNSI